MKIDQTKLNGIAHLLFAAVSKAQTALDNFNGSTDTPNVEGMKTLNTLTGILNDKTLVDAIESVKVKEELPAKKVWNNSTQISETAWDKDSGTLSVTFKTGATYEYFNVPEGVWADMLTAESVGKYLNAVVKGNYEFEKVD